MARLTLCAENFDINDQVFTVELENKEAISLFVDLVKNGGEASDLGKPSVLIESNGHMQNVSSRNKWQIDTDKI